MFEKTFALREYDAETRFSTAAGLDVLPIRLPHYTLETYGFRVTNGAATLAYTGDTGPSERIAELARDADLLVCEATLETGEADGEPRGHLSAEEALEAYAASGAKRLLLDAPPVRARRARGRGARLRRAGARGHRGGRAGVAPTRHARPVARRTSRRERTTSAADDP